MDSLKMKEILEILKNKKEITIEEWEELNYWLHLVSGRIQQLRPKMSHQQYLEILEREWSKDKLIQEKRLYPGGIVK